ncbi:VanZ family protein [Streptomyces sp. NPDC051561]|uniref:VanZ family protein n=1 Tax=Streptomyces sp. NPDC051561 TaxID=3365658 RepID=UPI0037944FD8
MTAGAERTRGIKEAGGPAWWQRAPELLRKRGGGPGGGAEEGKRGSPAPGETGRGTGFGAWARGRTAQRGTAATDKARAAPPDEGRATDAAGPRTWWRRPRTASGDTVATRPAPPPRTPWDGASRARTKLRAWGWVLFRVVAIALAFLALVAFAVVLAKLTLVPSPASEGIAHSNLKPGASLRQYLQDYTFLAACKQIGGNVLLGVPFGVLLPVVGSRRLRFLRMFLLSVTVMVLVELVQGAIVTGRAFDVDDVFMNTAGALLGYLVLGRWLGHVVHRRRYRETEPAPGPEPETA